jgi:splicing factor 3B subunit 1
MSGVDDEIKALHAERESGALTDGAKVPEAAKVGLTSVGGFDTDLYGTGDKFAGFTTAIVDEDNEDEEVISHIGASHPSSRTAAAKQSVHDAAGKDDGADPFAAYREAGGTGLVDTRISNRESDYQRRRVNRGGGGLSPERSDVFSGKTPARSYKDIMINQDLDRQKDELLRKVAKQQEAEAEAKEARAAQAASDAAKAGASSAQQQKAAAAALADSATAATAAKKRRRWDESEATPVIKPSAGGWDAEAETPVRSSAEGETPVGGAKAAAAAAAGGKSRWDQTPVRDDSGGATPAGGTQRRRNRWDETPVAAGATPRSSRWDDATPKAAAGAADGSTTAQRKKSRWDETPVAGGALGQATPAGGFTGETPYGAASMMTPTPSALAAAAAAAEPETPEFKQRQRWEQETADRNRPFTDEDLDAIFPAVGYKVRAHLLVVIIYMTYRML